MSLSRILGTAAQRMRPVRRRTPDSRWRVTAIVVAGVLAVLAATGPSRPALAQEASIAGLCQVVDAAAAAYRVPSGLLARMLWQESRFRSHVVSPKGAAGLAQFMPQTASSRGLVDPWNPILAIREAARYVADLNLQLGNFGLAAAGYNAGSARVRQWLQARSALPMETQQYVLTVTGRAAEYWASSFAARLPTDLRPCLQVVTELSHAAPAPVIRVAQPAPALSVVFTTRPASVAAPPPHQSPRVSPVFVANAQNLCKAIRELGADCRILVP